MAHFEFNHVPTIEEMVASSSQITRQVAAQILQSSAKWAGSDRSQQLYYINYLCNQVDTNGRDDWEDVRWSSLVSRINKLSSQINANIDQTVSAGRSGGRAS